MHALTIAAASFSGALGKPDQQQLLLVREQSDVREELRLRAV